MHWDCHFWICVENLEAELEKIESDFKENEEGVSILEKSLAASNERLVSTRLRWDTCFPTDV